MADTLAPESLQYLPSGSLQSVLPTQVADGTYMVMSFSMSMPTNPRTVFLKTHQASVTHN